MGKYEQIVKALSEAAGRMIDAYEQAARDAKSEAIQRSLSDRKNLIVDFLNSELNRLDSEFLEGTLPTHSEAFTHSLSGVEASGELSVPAPTDELETE